MSTLTYSYIYAPSLIVDVLFCSMAMLICTTPHLVITLRALLFFWISMSSQSENILSEIKTQTLIVDGFQKVNQNV